jgi:hypothetical protein
MSAELTEVLQYYTQTHRWDKIEGDYYDPVKLLPNEKVFIASVRTSARSLSPRQFAWLMKIVMRHHQYGWAIGADNMSTNV